MSGFHTHLDAQRTVPQAGELRAPPPQRLPAGVRLTLQLLAFPFVLIDVTVQRAARILFPPRYKLTGGCASSGQCCRFIILEDMGGFALAPVARSLVMWWASEVNGFYERRFRVDTGEDTEARVYSCRHLTDDNRCANYRLRPSLCRMYPRVDYFTRPVLHKGCGYSVVSNRPGEIDDGERSRSSLPVIDE